MKVTKIGLQKIEEKTSIEPIPYWPTDIYPTQSSADTHRGAPSSICGHFIDFIAEELLQLV